MKKKFILGNCYLNNHKTGFEHFFSSTLTVDPVTPNINRVPLLPRMDVWTKVEEGRSRRSPVNDGKWFWRIWPQWPWPLTHFHVIDWKKGYRLTDRHVQSNMPSLHRKGHKKQWKQRLSIINCTYPSTSISEYLVGCSQIGHCHFRFRQFIPIIVAASKHWMCEQFTPRHGTSRRFFTILKYRK